MTVALLRCSRCSSERPLDSSFGSATTKRAPVMRGRNISNADRLVVRGEVVTTMSRTPTPGRLAIE